MLLQRSVRVKKEKHIVILIRRVRVNEESDRKVFEKEGYELLKRRVRVFKKGAYELLEGDCACY